MEKIIAKALLDIGAVFFRPDEPFTWASGIKSPVYCDNRLILSAPEQRAVVEKAIADTVLREYEGCEMLMGTSTAGIPHAAIAAHSMGLPMGYVRARRQRPWSAEPDRRTHGPRYKGSGSRRSDLDRRLGD